MDTKAQKAAAERERKARIKRARENLAELPLDEQAVVTENAQEKELAARDAGSRRASVLFLEDAMVAWSIGGTVMAAGRRGVTLTPEQVREVVTAANDKYRGVAAEGVTAEVVDGDLGDALALRPGARNGKMPKPTAAAEATIDLDDPASVSAGVDRLANGLMDELRAKALAARARGLTVAEVAKEIGVNAGVARDLVGDAPAGKPGKAKAKAQAAPRLAREVRASGRKREEKCPDCGEWKPAQQDESGAYVKESDYRPGRRDCRACYNRRWLEAKQRREGARAGK